MQKKKGNGYGKGTFVETKLTLSHAFIFLGIRGTSPIVSSYSKNLLMMLLGKRQFSTQKDRKSGHKKQVRSDDNCFTLTYKELESHGIKKSSATRGFDELLAKGFISIVDQGGAYEKHKSVYALEDSYLRWNKIDKQIFFQRNKRDVPRGFQNLNSNSRINITTSQGGHPHDLTRGTPPPEDTTSQEGHPVLG
ncbi:MAG: hypothetical protein GY705_28780 [Bacteroidetes bacterium]|nr:hypothetical protein [Bacteroidota bacterium]